MLIILDILHFVDRASCNDSLVNYQRDEQILFYVFICLEHIVPIIGRDRLKQITPRYISIKVNQPDQSSSNLQTSRPPT